jgi:hypothetical protein
MAGQKIAWRLEARVLGVELYHLSPDVVSDREQIA